MADVMELIGAQMNDAWASLNQGAAQKQAQLQKVQDLQQGNAGDLRQSAADAALISAAEGAAALKTQQARLKAGAITGTDLSQQGEAISALTAQMMSSFQELQAAEARIAQKDSVSLTSDPLQYIVNQITINDDIAAYNSAVRKNQNAKDQAAALNAVAQTTITTQNALTAPLTEESVLAKSRQAAVIATTQAREAEIRAIGANIDSVNVALETDAKKLGLLFSYKGAQDAERTYAMQLQRMSMDREQFELAKQRELRMQRKDEEADAHDNSILEAINTGLAVTGGQPLTGMRGKEVVSLVKSGSPLGKDYYKYYKIGESARTYGTMTLGANPAEAIDVLSTLPVRLPEAQAPVSDLLKRSLGEVTRQPTYDPKNVTGNTAALNKIVQDKTDAMAKSVNYQDPKNIYNIPPLQALAERVPEIKALPVWQKVIGPAAVAGVEINDPNKVFAAVADQVRTGGIKFEEALEITEIYMRAAAVNTATRDLKKFGIIPRFSYNIDLTLTPPGLFDVEDTVDMTKPDAVSRALNKFLMYRATTHSPADILNNVRGFDAEYNKSIKRTGQEYYNTPGYKGN